ncbi:hypothetical protein ACRAWD_22895 [Caulobacter segnis]
MALDRGAALLANAGRVDTSLSPDADRRAAAAAESAGKRLGNRQRPSTVRRLG